MDKRSKLGNPFSKYFNLIMRLQYVTVFRLLLETALNDLWLNVSLLQNSYITALKQEPFVTAARVIMKIPK